MVKKSFSIICLLCVFLLTLSTSVFAEKKRIALIIGNGKYTGALLSPLKNPVNDAVLMSNTLKKTGFEVELLLNADQRQMKRAIQKFGDRLAKHGPETVGLFYFSGHGFQAKNVNYLAPLKASLKNEADAEIEAVSVDWVTDKMEYAKNKVNIVILDACRNNALASTTRSAKRGLALVRGPQGSFVAFSTEPGGIALDGAGLNSPYTSAIAREISKPGLSIERVFKNVRKSVIKNTKGEQIPWDYSSLTSDFYFVPGDKVSHLAPRSAESLKELQSTKLELQLWNDVKDSGSSEELNSYITKYPNGTFVQAAQARIRALKASGGKRLPYRDIHQRFAKLTTGQGNIQSAPQNPLEFYANARLHELKGDYIKARQSYLKYFSYGLIYVDPHYRFMGLLKIQDGRAGAREVYHEFAQRDKNYVVKFAKALLQPRKTRIGKLETLIRTNPEFAPAYFELSKDFSEARLGSQSISDKRREAELLKNFMKLVKEGKFLRYYIDQQFAIQQVDNAKQRLAALSLLADSALKNPVSINATRSNSGWVVALSIADDAQEIFYSMPGKPFQSLGFSRGNLNQKTGKPLANNFFTLPKKAKPTAFQVKYLDLRGKEQGPYTLNFDPDKALFASQKQILERMSNSWVSFRDWDNERLVYFSHLVSYRCAIESIEFGVNTSKLTKRFPLSPCNKKDPHSIRTASGKNSKVLIELPRSTRFVTVKIKYKDGTYSEAKRFDAN